MKRWVIKRDGFYLRRSDTWTNKQAEAVKLFDGWAAIEISLRYPGSRVVKLVRKAGK